MNNNCHHILSYNVIIRITNCLPLLKKQSRMEIYFISVSTRTIIGQFNEQYSTAWPGFVDNMFCDLSPRVLTFIARIKAC